MIYGAINKSIASLVVLPFFIFALVKVILNFKNKDTKISSESIKKNFKIFLNGLKATIFVFAKILQFLSVIIVVYLLYYLVTDNAAYNKLPSLINRIESKHNVNVEVDGMMKDDAMVSYYDFIRYGNRGKNAYKSLESAEAFLDKLPEELVNELNSYCVLGDKLKITATPYQYDGKAGMQTHVYGEEIYLYYSASPVLDIIDHFFYPNEIEETFSHEFFHALESAVAQAEGNLMRPSYFSDWNHYNPSNFSYDNSYGFVNGYNTKYVFAYNKSANNNAFVSVYSKTYDYEDRAELFESLCYNDDFTKKSLENEKIAKKTKMLIEYIKEYYPSCKEGSFWEDTYNKYTENNK